MNWEESEKTWWGDAIDLPAERTDPGEHPGDGPCSRSAPW